MKFVLYFLIAAYLLFAFVQFNDPDPLVWIFSYLISAFLCYYRIRHKENTIFYFMVGLLYILWSINQFPPQWEGLMIDQMSMKTINVELGRESLGLAMCGIGMWVCMFRK